MTKTQQEVPGLANEADTTDTRKIHRWSVSIFFIMHGLCFAAWASRIPTVQSMLGIGNAELGLILVALPLGFFISAPFSGWMISKAGSRRATVISAVLYSLSLALLSVSSSVEQVTGCLFLFGFFANALNLSMNTQAVEVERLYKKRLMSTFHGLWSLAGFAGAAIGAWSTARSISLPVHFASITILFLVSILIFAPRLVKSSVNKEGNRRFFALPEKSMLIFGAIAFCSAITEGAMFDWSGIYFKDIVKVDSAFTGLGYTMFMVAMATGRFCADALAERFTLRRVLITCGVLVTFGLLLSVVYPMLIPAAIGFVMIGAGVSSVVPLVYSTAGRSKTMEAGAALTAVSSLGFLGFLIGPSMIGFVAGLTSLKGSFTMLMIASTALVILASYIKRDV